MDNSKRGRSMPSEKNTSVRDTTLLSAVTRWVHPPFSVAITSMPEKTVKRGDVRANFFGTCVPIIGRIRTSSMAAEEVMYRERKRTFWLKRCGPLDRKALESCEMGSGKHGSSFQSASGRLSCPHHVSIAHNERRAVQERFRTRGSLIPLLT